MLSSHSQTRKLKRIYDQACKTQTGPQVWERRNEVSPTQASQILTIEAIGSSGRAAIHNGLLFVINPMQLNLQTNWENHVAKIELKPYQMSKQQVKI
jgi:hypothetical protein